MKLNSKKQQVIILEGPDSTGKTEIGKALSDKIGVPYFKNSYERERIFRDARSDLATYCGLYMADFLENTGNSVILDRFHISEYVYAQVYNRETSVDDILEIENKLTNIDAKIIYCYKNDLRDYEDEDIDKGKIRKIKYQYEEYFSKYQLLELLKLKTDDKDLDNQIRKIVHFLKIKDYLNGRSE